MQRPGPQLPSIRQLHPYLPPTPAVASSSYAGSPEAADDQEHEQEDNDSEPPKKKRRRQALSCTECKRRKIRCDRTQPCTPCAKRGDEAKCQWHVVEPATEKYVPRAEYDALRARVDALEAYIARAPPGSLPPFAVSSVGTPGAGSAQQEPGFNPSFRERQRPSPPVGHDPSATQGSRVTSQAVASSPLERFAPAFSPPPSHIRPRATVSPSHTQGQSSSHSDSQHERRPSISASQTQSNVAPGRAYSHSTSHPASTHPPAQSIQQPVRRTSISPLHPLPRLPQQPHTSMGFGVFPAASGTFPAVPPAPGTFSSAGGGASRGGTAARRSSSPNAAFSATSAGRNAPSGGGSTGTGHHSTSSSSRSHATLSANPSFTAPSRPTSISTRSSLSASSSRAVFSASRHVSLEARPLSRGLFNSAPQTSVPLFSPSSPSRPSGGGGMVFQHVHDPIGAVHAPAAISFKRPRAASGARLRDETQTPRGAPKNRSAQAPQGPRLRAHHAPWASPPLLRTRLPRLLLWDLHEVGMQGKMLDMGVEGVEVLALDLPRPYTVRTWTRIILARTRGHHKEAAASHTRPGSAHRVSSSFEGAPPTLVPPISNVTYSAPLAHGIDPYPRTGAPPGAASRFGYLTAMATGESAWRGTGDAGYGYGPRP